MYIKQFYGHFLHTNTIFIFSVNVYNMFIVHHPMVHEWYVQDLNKFYSGTASCWQLSDKCDIHVRDVMQYKPTSCLAMS